MPASIAYAMIHGTDLDLNPGPNGNLAHSYYDGAITLNAGYANQEKMQDYQANNASHLFTTPEFSVSAPLVLKKENSTFGNVAPGTGLTRAVIACAGDRGGHGFPLDLSAPGYFVVGNITSSVENGKYRKYPFNAELFGFTVSNALNGGV